MRTLINSGKYKMKKGIIIALVASVLLSGCATIVGDKTQLIKVDSNPSGAAFKVEDEKGNVVSTGTTPQSVMLAKSDGSYFGKKSYRISYEKSDHSPVTLPLKTAVNGWYIGGNILFGGLIGWLLVDPFNGGMYTINPESAYADMTSSQQ